MQGYIKLHRSILDNTIFKCKPFSKGQAWITLLMLTNHKEGYINVKNGELIKIKRGECGYSELALADLFGWSRGKVKRFLELLKSEKMIHQKTVANRTIISILNYDNYQNDTINSTVNDTVNGHLTIHQTDINNNDKNDNNEKNDNKGIINAPNPNNIFNPIVKEFHNQMKDVLHYNIRLNGFQCDKVVELNQRIPDFIKSIPVVFERLKLISWNFEDGSIVNADVNWLLDKENYISVLNGKYTTKQQIIQEKLRRKEQDNERR